VTVVHHNAGEQGWVVCDDAIDPKGDQFFERRLLIHRPGDHGIEASVVSRRHDLRDFVAAIWPYAHTATHTDMAHTELPGKIVHAGELKAGGKPIQMRQQGERRILPSGRKLEI